MAGAGMVGMAMGDHRALDGAHGIDVEVARFAAEAGGDGSEQVLRTHDRHIGSRSAHSSLPPVPKMPARLFFSSGDLLADRRFEFARDLQLKGDLPAADDLLEQAIDLAPNFPSAWFTLGEIRQQLKQDDKAVAAFQKARAADPEDRHGAAVKFMRRGPPRAGGTLPGF